MTHVLITGGAGFIGSHLAAALVARGDRVRVLDAFVEQVHGRTEKPGAEGIESVRGDLRDRDLVDRSLDGIDAVFHLAAEVGVGQSMYDIRRYVSANSEGTAVLLEALTARRDRIGKLVVASSMSIYGEGGYRCPSCGPVEPGVRSDSQVARREWEPRCTMCASPLSPVPTPESKRLEPTSVYAITKQDQELLCLTVGRAYGIPTVALRYFNVYGPGQALSNPYTGVVAIFAGRLLGGAAPIVFEDGLQTRDFVHVSDVVAVNLQALASDSANGHAINVGTGRATSVLRVAELLRAALGVEIDPLVDGRFRQGDIRHCVADITLARKVLGFEPTVDVERGIPELAAWVRDVRVDNRSEQAASELNARGLLR